MKFRKKPVIVEAVKWTGNNEDEISKVIDFDKLDIRLRVDDDLLTLRCDVGSQVIKAGMWIVLSGSSLSFFLEEDFYGHHEKVLSTTIPENVKPYEVKNVEPIKPGLVEELTPKLIKSELGPNIKLEPKGESVTPVKEEKDPMEILEEHRPALMAFLEKEIAESTAEQEQEKEECQPSSSPTTGEKNSTIQSSQPSEDSPKKKSDTTMSSAKTSSESASKEKSSEKPSSSTFNQKDSKK